MNNSNEVKHTHKQTEILNAYVWIRTNNSSIPDDILDFMKDAALAHDRLKLEIESLKDYLDTYNKLKKDKALLLETLNGLPSLLSDAANSLEIQAKRIGMTNALAPDLKTYADKIEYAIQQAK